MDVLDNEIRPARVVEIARDFARLHSIPENWLNNDASSLKADLPVQWESRRVEVFRGKAIRFLTLGRADLLKAKLGALCDRARDFEDVIAMKPSHAELLDARARLNPLDRNPGWTDHVEITLNEVSRALRQGGSDE